MTTLMPHNLREPILWLLLTAGALSPLTAFPLTRSCLPLASYLFCLSLSCLAYMVIRLLLHRGVLASDLWPENSPQIKKWSHLQSALYLLSAIFLVVSFCLWRPWHPNRINWQGIFSAPGLVLITWAGAVGDYIQSRRSTPKRRSDLLAQAMPPIHSDHWGKSSGAPQEPNHRAFE